MDEHTIEVIDATTPEGARTVYAEEVASMVADLDVPYPQKVAAAAQAIANGINHCVGLAVAAVGDDHPQIVHRALVGMVVRRLADRGVRPEASVRVGVDVLMRS